MKNLSFSNREINFLQVAVDILLEQIQDEPGKDWAERTVTGDLLKIKLNTEY